MLRSDLPIRLVIIAVLTLLVAGGEPSSTEGLFSLPLQEVSLGQMHGRSLQRFRPRASENANQVQNMFYVTLYIGSNNVPFNLLLDTGSSWFWVAHPNCVNCDPHTRKLDFQSNTLKDDVTKTKKINYPMGWVQGNQMTDDITVGDERLSAEAIDIVAVTQVDPNSVFATSQWQSDGILGLGPLPTENGVPPSFVQEMYTEGNIDHNMFSIYLTDWWRARGQNTQSKIWFGGYPHDQIKALNGWSHYSNADIDSKVAWIPIKKYSRRWELTLSKVTKQVDGATTQLASSGTVLISTGSQFNSLPSVHYNQLEQQVQQEFQNRCQKKTDNCWGSEGLYCPCVPNKLSGQKLPSLSYYFRKQDGKEAEFTFDPEYYFLFDVDTQSNMDEERDCLFSFQPSDDNGFVLGSAFIRRYFSIFDMAENRQRIGFIGGNFPVAYKYQQLLVSRVLSDRYDAFAVWWICASLLISIIACVILVCFCVRGCDSGCCRSPKNHLRIRSLDPPRVIFKKTEPVVYDEPEVQIRTVRQKSEKKRIVVSKKRSKGREEIVIRDVDDECIQCKAEDANKDMFNRIEIEHLKKREMQREHELQHSESQITIRTDAGGRSPGGGLTRDNSDFFGSRMRNSLANDDSFDQRSRISISQNDKQVSFKEDMVGGGAGAFMRHGRSNTYQEEDAFGANSVISESVELSTNIGQARPPNSEEYRIFNGLQSTVGQLAGKRFSVFETVACVSQSERGGVLYVVKFHIGNNRYVHGKIFVQAGGKSEVKQVEVGQTETSPLQF